MKYKNSERKKMRGDREEAKTRRSGKIADQKEEKEKTKF